MSFPAELPYMFDLANNPEAVDRVFQSVKYEWTTGESFVGTCLTEEMQSFSVREELDVYRNFTWTRSSNLVQVGFLNKEVAARFKLMFL